MFNFRPIGWKLLEIMWSWTFKIVFLENRTEQNLKRKQKVNFVLLRIKKAEVGDLIDVRDPNFVWCVGIVKRLIKKSDNKQRSFIIHYEVSFVKF